tara:strand:- start:2295 stop:3101 length:807 start_codon:yes stop_codon:yes gene_type:complete
MKLGSVLKKIIQDKKKLIEEKKGIIPFERLIEKASGIKEPTNFLDIFQKEEVALIAEIKRSSASAGDILPQLDIDEITNLYVNSGVSAISILTEKTRFSGSIEDLKNVSTICKNKNIPVLQKDFIFDTYQLYEGALNGASAALVIVSILDEKELNEIIKTCHQLSITPLVEIFNESELSLAINNGAELIGINNRNLNNLETSLSVFEDLAPKVPKDKILISESGIKNIDHVKLMAEQGADGVLVGESILKSNDINAHIKKLSSIKKCK